MNKIDKIIDLLRGGTKISGAIKEVYGSQKISLSFNEKDFNVPLIELQISNRSYNALKRKGLNTLNDVVEYFNNQGWNSIRNFGKKSATEMFEKFIDVAWENMNDMQKAAFLLSMNN